MTQAQAAEPSADGAQSQSLYVRTAGRTLTFPAGAAVTVGRDGRCDVVVDDPRVSRRHAELRCDSNGWTVRDLDSANGTWAVGERVDALSVSGGSELMLGDPVDGTAVVLQVGGVGAAQFTGVEVSIGRALDNDVVVTDPLVSRHHASLHSVGTELVLKDLSGRNRSFVNGEVADAAHRIGEGDRITVGNTDLRWTRDGLVVAGRESDVHLAVENLGYRLKGGKQLLQGVDFQVRAGELLAVIGPSGAGKSTLSRLLTGISSPSFGQVLNRGLNLHEHLEELRARIGFVPQDDIVHGKLTARQALRYAAELRLPEDTSDAERSLRVTQALEEVGISGHADVRIERLSGGQRKRVSIALELLTEPPVLILDEPTSGLDPALDFQVMSSLRGMADRGRSIVVITHNVANLGVCDTVLLLATGGVPAYVGSPRGLLDHFGARDWETVYRQVTLEPERAHSSYLREVRRRVAPATTGVSPPDPATTVTSAPTSMRRQVRTLAARHVRIIAADRPYLAFLCALPLVLALLTLAVPGGNGFGPPSESAPSEPLQVLVILVVGAAFMGIATSVRDIVAEQAILRRERAVGLNPMGYVGAKLGVYVLLSLGQAALLTGTVLLVRPGPETAVLLGSGGLELYAAVALTTVASSVLGLLVSATVRSSDQVMPVVVAAVMGLLVLCGGLIPVAGRGLLDVVSWLAPTRWGYAAAASTVDVRELVPTATQDALWTHAPGEWLLAICALVVLSAAFAVVVFHRVRAVRC